MTIIHIETGQGARGKSSNQGAVLTTPKEQNVLHDQLDTTIHCRRSYWRVGFKRS